MPSNLRTRYSRISTSPTDLAAGRAILRRQRWPCQGLFGSRRPPVSRAGTSRRSGGTRSPCNSLACNGYQARQVRRGAGGSARTPAQPGGQGFRRSTERLPRLPPQTPGCPQPPNARVRRLSCVVNAPAWSVRNSSARCLTRDMEPELLLHVIVAMIVWAIWLPLQLASPSPDECARAGHLWLDRDCLRTASRSADPPRQAHPFVVDTPQFPHLELAERRPSAKERPEPLVARVSLLTEPFVTESREVLR